MRTVLAGAALAMLVGGAGYGVAQSVRSISAADKATGAKAHPGLLQEFGGAYTAGRPPMPRRWGGRWP